MTQVGDEKFNQDSVYIPRDFLEKKIKTRTQQIFTTVWYILKRHLTKKVSCHKGLV